MRSLGRLVIVIAGLVSFACGSPDDGPSERVRSGLQRANEQRLELAVQMMEGSLGALQDGGGYQSWTATRAAENLVVTLNTSMAPLPGEAPVPGPEIEFTLTGPTAPWQVVLTPDDEARTIDVRAFAVDLERPHLTRTIAVPMY